MDSSAKKQLDRMLVKISHLDTLLNLVGEVIITSNNLQSSNRMLQDFYERKAPLSKLLLDMLRATEVSSSRISSELHGLVMDIRMVEIRQTFQRFRRSVRDMAKETGKQVEFVTIGEETLVDKTIAEKLYDPLTHQIRNAIDHGIESPLERQQKGKPPTAVLTLKATQKENNLTIEIRDDGRGIDASTVATAAVSREAVTPEQAQEMTDQQKLGLIFLPGLSTRTEASNLSGRGVGMDVVKSNIEELGGSVGFETVVGSGSVFTYTIPQLTAVNIVDCLTVRAGFNYFAIPILDVGATLGVPADAVSTAFQTGKTITVLNELVTLFDMNELLGDPPLDEAANLTVVIIEAKNGRIALQVSELLSPEKLVFSPLSGLFDVQGISGTTVLAGNRMGLIIDTVEMINLSRGIGKNAEESREKDGLAALTEGQSAQEDVAAPAAVPVESVVEARKERVAPSDGAGLLEISHRDEFIMELEAMIKDADEQILLLEQRPGDMDIINRIFRDFHSMKGNLMMVGLSDIGEFIHEVEVILDQVRNETLTIDADIIDILLDSSDAIKVVNAAISANNTPSLDPALRSRVGKYQAEIEEEKQESVDIHQRTFRSEGVSLFNLMARRKKGESIIQLYLKIKPEFQQPFVVALLIIKRICEIGTLLGTVPDMVEITGAHRYEELKVKFSTQKTQAEVNAFVEEVLVKYYDVTEYESMVDD